MKRLFIFVSLLLLLSGCSVSYEINLVNDKIEEKLTIIENDQSLFDVENDTGWTLRQIFDSFSQDTDNEFSVENYSVKSLNDETRLGLEYKSDSSKSLINSSVINQCYNKPTMFVEENVITFNTGNDFKCYEYYENLETISIVLKTNNKVLSSNADLVEDNIYTWNITKDGNKQIEISYEIKESKEFNIVTILIIIVVAIVSIGVSFYVYKKFKNENKI